MNSKVSSEILRIFRSPSYTPNFIRIVIHLIVIFKMQNDPLISMALLFLDINIVRNINDLLVNHPKKDDYVYRTYSAFLAFSNRFLNILILLENSDITKTRMFPLFIFSDFFSLGFSSIANVYMRKKKFKAVEKVIAGIDQRQDSIFDNIIESYFSLYLLFYFFKICLGSTSDFVTIIYVLTIPAFFVTFLIKILETAYGFWYVVQEDMNN